MYLAVATFGLSLTNVMDTEAGVFCSVQATLFTFFSLASFLWSSCLAFSIFRRARYKQKDQMFSMWYHVIGWGVPVVFTGVLLYMDVFDYASDQCWISEKWKYLRVPFEFAPLWICLIFNLVMFLLTYKIVHNKSGLRRFVLFPLMFVICWAVGTITWLMELFLPDTKPIYIFFVFHSVLGYLQGFLNAIIFIISTADIRRIKKKTKRIMLSDQELLEKVSSSLSSKWDNIQIVAVYLMVVVLRGSLQLIVSMSTDIYPPFTLLALRTPVSMLGLGLMGLIKARTDKKFADSVPQLFTRNAIFRLFIMGLVSFVAPNICFSYADRGIKVGVASVLMSITPIFVLLFGQYNRSKQAKPEEITRYQVFGIIVGFIGVVTICFFSSFQDADITDDEYIFCILSVHLFVAYLSDLLFVFGVVCQSIAIVYWRTNKRVDDSDPKKGDIHWIIGNFSQNAVGLMVGVVCSLVIDFNFPISPFQKHYGFLGNIGHERDGWYPGIFVFVWLSVFSGVIAFSGQFYLLGKIGDKTGTVTYGFPVVGMIEGIFFRGDWAGVPLWERLVQVAGAVLVICGLVLCNKKPPPPQKGETASNSVSEPSSLNSSQSSLPSIASLMEIPKP